MPRPMLSRVRNRVRRLLVDTEKGNYPDAVNVGEASAATLDFLRTTDARVIAEIGVYQGHTSREIATWLGGEGELHLFDFHSTVKRVAKELRDQGHKNVKAFGNSHKYLDSYNWPLAKVLRDNPEPVYDYVFIDGAHTWAVDGFTTLLADRLLKPGGHLDFDDYSWTLARSPTLRPSVFPLTGRMYTDEQVKAQQVRMIVDLLVRRDPRYTEVVPDRVFRKER